MNVLVLLEKVINTLEQVEVKGSENMNHMLGCINALRSIVSETEKNDEDSKTE